MDEAGWLGCAECWPMLQFLQAGRPKPTRKLRLFAVACCRRIWRVLHDEGSRVAVETAEAFVEGAATSGGLSEARKRAQNAERTALRRWAAEGHPDSGPSFVAVVATQAAATAASARATTAGLHTLSPAQAAAAGARNLTEARGREQTAQLGLLRCIFGNPFRRLAASRRAWRTPTILTLAEAVYRERELPAGTLDPKRLAVLADALEEAGCADSDILRHLRAPGAHVRGCVAVDAVLGKK